MTAFRQHSHEDLIWHQLLSFVAGMFVALCFLKFGNPVIFEERLNPPADILEFIYMAWPLAWGYVAVGCLALTALPVMRWKRGGLPKWVLFALLIWFGWQFVAATHTVQSKLTAATLRHFTACLVCFGVGYLALSEVKNKKWLWWGVVTGLVLMIKSGFEQHLGGFEATRRYFELYQVDKANIPPDFLKKIYSDRIFGTMFYPNSFAGVILLTLPVALVFLFTVLPSRLKRVVPLLLVAVSLFALFWSGSKAGWLLCLGSAGGWVLSTPIGPRVKIYILGGILVAGLATFGIKYAGFFQKGATSVVARSDYWRAAWQVTKDSPYFGTGPGTFMVPYEKLKAPNAEMTRLVHNDYLEQASDSGVIGFLAYGTFIAGALLYVYRHSFLTKAKNEVKSEQKQLNLALALGLAGLALHGFAEFHLYIAGLAWPFFLFLGMACGTPNQIDKEKSGGRVVAP